MSEKDRWYSNPSLGLGVWGPLTPANDCLWCRNVCIGLQVFAGISLIRRVRNPNPLRNRWTNLGIKLSGYLGGLYLISAAGIELSRYLLRSDPWYSDAVVVRRKNPSKSLFEDWFGPLNYKAVTFEEFVKRAGNSRSKPRLSKEARIQSTKVTLAVKEANRRTLNQILHQIKNGTFNPPGESVRIPLLSELGGNFEQEFEDLNQWPDVNKAKLAMVVFPCSGTQID